MKKEQDNNSRRNFLKMAAFGGAALGIASVPGLTNAADLSSEDSAFDQVGNTKKTGKLHGAKGKSVMGLTTTPLKQSA